MPGEIYTVVLGGIRCCSILPHTYETLTPAHRAWTPERLARLILAVKSGKTLLPFS
jgi:hypothetical protein